MPVALRGDFDAPSLRAAARESRDAGQVRRLVALAAIYDGSTRTEAAKIGGVTLQIVRDWVVKFNAHGPAGLIDRKAPGQPSRLNETHRAALAEIIASGPIPAIHGVVRWRLIDLCQWLWEEFRVPGWPGRRWAGSFAPCHGLSQVCLGPAAPSRAAEGAIEHFKKSSQSVLDEIAREQGHKSPATIEIWFGDEARIGQKNKITRRWARRGTRPAAPHDQRTARATSSVPSAPRTARVRTLAMPRCNIEAMNLHLAEIAIAVAPGAHDVGAAARPSRLAHVRPVGGARQHHARSVTAQMPRTQPDRKRLAVHA